MYRALTPVFVAALVVAGCSRVHDDIAYPATGAAATALAQRDGVRVVGDGRGLTRVFRDASTTAVGELRHRGTVAAVAIDPQLGRVLSLAHDGSVKMWNLADGKEEPGFDARGDSICTSLALSPDQGSVAIGDAEGAITVWSLATRAATLRMKMPSALSADFLAFTPDGAAIVVGHGGRRNLPPNDPTADIQPTQMVLVSFSSVDGSPGRRILGPGALLEDLVSDRDGVLAAVVGGTQLTVRRYALPGWSPQDVATAKAGHAPVQPASIDPAAMVAAYVDGEDVIAWDAARNARIATIRRPGSPRMVALCVRGNDILIGHDDGSATVATVK
jgi:hypothetical protein